jgi:hypothetical protein
MPGGQPLQNGDEAVEVVPGGQQIGLPSQFKSVSRSPVSVAVVAVAKARR